nr:Chain U, U3 small nucleolar RNA-associated protein MPP10 [Saccharomyces cerevisiae S288C]5WXM_V Chain V, U3 small nucleolar RNA-associated protein MPP10 [Saccharomyces cerevisiae S288C]
GPLQKAHSEISELYANLVYKLDVLSSVHFVPKPA